jgi:RNA-directed DNA polymerase
MDRTLAAATLRSVIGDAGPGVDGITWETYERDLDRRIETLHERVQAGT